MEKPKAIVFDIDLTLADSRHRDYLLPHKKLTFSTLSADKKQQLWDLYVSFCDLDTPIKSNILLAQIFFETGFKVLLVSGRNETARTKTEKWMKDNNVFFHQMLLRPIGDLSTNSQLKLGMLEKLSNFYSITCVVEDNIHTVKALREAGYAVYQVENGSTDDI